MASTSSKQVDKIRKKRLLEENEREDKFIRSLEKRMKMNRRKRKTLPRSFVDDGLSYILEACDSETLKTLEPENDFLQQSDVWEDSTLLEETENEKKPKKDFGNMVNNDRDIDSDASIGDDVEITKKITKKKKKSVTWKDEKENEDAQNSDDKNENEDDDDDDDLHTCDDEENGETSGTDNDDEKDEFWEDIYGRQRDKKGNVVSSDTPKFIPPAKRELDNSKSAQMLRLTKQLKGLINKLNESNVKSISSQMEDLYSNNSRNDMNETLSQQIVAVVVQSTVVTHVEHYAMLIALLHANVGSEVGAHFLQTLVVMFNKMHHENGNEDDGKKIHNVLLLLAHLYSFKVVNSLLIMNILNCLVEKFEAIDVELILLMLKHVGFMLRKDDPVTLKDMIARIQAKAHTLANEENDSRIRFMLELLTAIRNNNVHKMQNFDPNHVENCRKLLRGYIRKGCGITVLRISLQDLLNAEENGRWWIVGSAWSGQQEEGSALVSKNVDKSGDVVNEKVLELARKQRMNTDIRRKIFCIIMTAEDCLDSFQKLIKLRFNNTQEREIVHVVVHCSMNEVPFNPYYAFLAAKLCNFNRKFQMAFQFALWDQFKGLDSIKENQLTNLAEFVASLLLSKGISLTVLKVIQFAEMDKFLIQFLRKLLLRVLFNESEEELVAIFQRISGVPKLRMLREGLRLFLHHFMLRQKNIVKDDDDKKKLKLRVDAVEAVLIAGDSLVRF